MRSDRLVYVIVTCSGRAGIDVVAVDECLFEF